MPRTGDPPPPQTGEPLPFEEPPPEAEGREVTERELVGLLKPYRQMGKEIDRLRRDRERLAKPIREWLEAHPGEDLQDGETGLRGYLEERRGGLMLDTINCGPDLLAWAGDHGLLKLDNAALKAWEGKAPEILRLKDHCYPGGGSTALQVKEDKECRGR